MEGDGTAVRHSAVELPALSRTSMSKTSLPSRLSIIKRPLLVGVVPSPGAAEAVAVEEPGTTIPEVGPNVAVAVDLRGEETISEAAGEVGEIGRRFISKLNVFRTCGLFSSQNNRTRESSVVISPQWSMLEEIEFHRLTKLRLEVDEPVDL